jgi:hypothetical protein
VRVKDGGYTWENKENVHFSSIQDTVKDSIKKLNGISAPGLSYDIASLITDPKIKKIVEKDLQSSPEYLQISQKVLEVAKQFDIDTQVIIDEIHDGAHTCLTGKISRIVNALNGFVPGVGTGLSKTEEVANSIVVIRNRNTLLYGNDNETYINETIPAVLQILEDACIPLPAQGPWLEYV